MKNNHTADQVISTKRDGKKLSHDQIEWFVSSVVNGQLQLSQSSALLMAIYIHGCDKEETASLTKVMLNSGKVFNFDDIRVIDKHSTGGVGDKTSLILGPIAAAAGVKVPMISGRGLGHTGGTIDKMESIPGYRSSLELNEFLEIFHKVGIAIIAQTDDLVPADKILYNLRDLTSTVASVPLITASIMSKKLAEGTSGLVMDIKMGQGAFMKNKSEARILANSLRHTAQSFGRNIVTMITDMSQPLGVAIGNSNEVIESLETLKGRGPKDITTLSIELAAAMIFLAGIANSMPAARKLAKDQIHSGRALLKFQEMIRAQGGNAHVVDDYSLLPMAQEKTLVLALQDGYVASIDAKQLGLYVCSLGGSRKTSGDSVDHGVGILNHVKIGDKIKKGSPLATIQHHQNQATMVSQIAEEMVAGIYKIKKDKLSKLPELIGDVDFHWCSEKRS